MSAAIVVRNAALVVAVTAGSVGAGALIASPDAMGLVRPYLPMLAGGTLCAAAALGVTKLLTMAQGRLTRGARPAATRTGVSRAVPSLAPVFSMGQGRTERTPRAVRALADAGTAPTEIAWRTGMPVDAVSLLLAMSTASRQLQPPVA